MSSHFQTISAHKIAIIEVDLSSLLNDNKTFSLQTIVTGNMFIYFGNNLLIAVIIGI